MGILTPLIAMHALHCVVDHCVNVG